jgi:hypothetical protein
MSHFTATLSALLSGALNLVGVGGLLGLKSGPAPRTEAVAKHVSSESASLAPMQANGLLTLGC